MGQLEAQSEHVNGAQPGVLTDTDLIACVEAATAAPSIHNSQPWRFRLRDGGIDVLADWQRRLEVIDPAGRELVISVGAAILNLRIAMRLRGRVPVVRVVPARTVRELVVRVEPAELAVPSAALDALAEAIPRRHTNRRPFTPTLMPVSVLEELAEAAVLEGAVVRLAEPVGRGAVMGLLQTAEQHLRGQGIYRGEVAGWTLPTHPRSAAMPPRAFGAWDALEALPLRDFGLMQPQLHRHADASVPYPTIVVLSTDGDTVEDWLRAGQALQRILLVATVHGLAATPMSQPLENPALRELLSDGPAGRWPQVVLRLGYAAPTTPTGRRPLAEVVSAG